jgi:hypothetical protein
MSISISSQPSLTAPRSPLTAAQTLVNVNFPYLLHHQNTRCFPVLSLRQQSINEYVGSTSAQACGCQQSGDGCCRCRVQGGKDEKQTQSRLACPTCNMLHSQLDGHENCLGIPTQGLIFNCSSCTTRSHRAAAFLTTQPTEANHL